MRNVSVCAICVLSCCLHMLCTQMVYNRCILLYVYVDFRLWLVVGGQRREIIRYISFIYIFAISATMPSVTYLKFKLYTIITHFQH